MKSARGVLITKIVIAILGCMAIGVLLGPWWYVAFCLAAMGLIVVDAIRTYRKETRNSEEP